MSLYFNKFIKGIKNTKIKVTNLKTEFNSYVKHEKEMGNDPKKIRSPPFFIKSNPYYWTFKIKNTMQENLDKFVKAITPGNFRQIIYNQSETSLENKKEGMKNTLDIIKKTTIVIVDKFNNLVKKITFDKVDLFKITKAILKPESYGMIVNNTINFAIKVSNLIYKILVILNKKIYTYMEKYKDKNINSDFIKYNKELSTKIEKYYKNKNGFFSKVIPSTISTVRFMLQSHQISKVNRFLKLPRTMQKVYYVRNYFDEFISKFKRLEKDKTVSKFNFEEFKRHSKKLYQKKNFLRPSSMYRLMKQGTKRLFLKIFAYICLAFFIINSIKFSLNKILNRNADNKLKEALDLVKDLKKQNEELMKYNMQFMEKFGKKE